MRFFVSTILSFCIVCIVCEDGAPTTGTRTATTDTSAIKTSVKTESPTTIKYKNATSCERYSNCEECSKNHECYFCQENNMCKTYVLKEVLPNKECQLKDVYYGTCSISLLVTIILISIGAGIVLILIIVCCCCCCRSGSALKLSKDDLKWARQREERRMRAEEKRKERASRTEMIRQKYGLFRDENPYQKFDA